MTAALPWLLLASTLTVRFALARKWRWGFALDLCSVPAWSAYYASRGDWPLLGVPLLFALLDIQGLRNWKEAKQ